MLAQIYMYISFIMFFFAVVLSTVFTLVWIALTIKGSVKSKAAARGRNSISQKSVVIQRRLSQMGIMPLPVVMEDVELETVEE